MRGAWILYHSFAFHLSFTLRPAEALGFFAGAIFAAPFTVRCDSLALLKHCSYGANIGLLKNNIGQIFFIITIRIKLSLKK
jgi:hypothetical protein